MAFNMPLEVPDTGAVFTFGKSRFADNAPSYFFVKNDPIVDVSCGDEHTIVVCGKGRIFSFGRNAHGELGLSHRSATSRPNCVKGLKSYKTKSVACGGAHSLVLTDDGQVFSSGKNDDGQLGLNDFEERDSFEPVQFQSSPGEMRQISAGFCHSACLDAEGQVYVWGNNKCGQLGLDPDANPCVHTPTPLPMQYRCVQVACGYYHTLILTDDGQIWSFGEGDEGKLGYTSNDPINWSPTRIDVGIQFELIDAGGNHSGAISRDGDVYMWGANDCGQLGVEEPHWDSVTGPVKMKLNTKVAYLSLGENHSAIVTEHRELYMFGDNRHGKAVLDRNNGIKLDRLSVPTRVNKLHGFEVSKVSCGGCHTMVLASRRPPLVDICSITSSDDSVFETNKSSLPPLQRRSSSVIVGGMVPLSSSLTSSTTQDNKTLPVDDDRPPSLKSVDSEKETNDVKTVEMEDDASNYLKEDESCQTTVEEYLDKSVNCKIEDLISPEDDCTLVVPLDDHLESKKTSPNIAHTLLEKLNLSLPKSELKLDRKDKSDRKVSKTCDLL